MIVHANGVEYNGTEANQGKGDGVLGGCSQSGSLKKGQQGNDLKQG